MKWLRSIGLFFALAFISNGAFAQGQQQSGEQYLANRTYSDFAQSGDASEVSSGPDVYTKVGDHQIDVVA